MATELDLIISDDGQPAVRLDGTRVESLAGLNAVGLDLRDPPILLQYCEAANHLAHGFEYRIIDDPIAYRHRYEARWQAEDPDAPFQQGAPKLHDFGHSDTAQIEPPHVDGDRVIAYAEDDYLGIPYRVSFPIVADSQSSYEPLDITPAS